MRKYTSFISISLLTLFIGYMTCIYAFTHTHVINGVVIVHSHRTSQQKDSTKNPIQHAHDKTQIVVLSQLSNSTTTLDSPNYSLKVFCHLLVTTEIPSKVLYVISGIEAINPLRGPPTLV